MNSNLKPHMLRSESKCYILLQFIIWYNEHATQLNKALPNLKFKPRSELRPENCVAAIELSGFCAWATRLRTFYIPAGGSDHEQK